MKSQVDYSTPFDRLPTFLAPTDEPVLQHVGGGEYAYQRSDHAVHRIDGPATHEGGVEYWYRDGFLHRVDGPAMVEADEEDAWYLYGIQADQHAILKFVAEHPDLPDAMIDTADPNGWVAWHPNGMGEFVTAIHHDAANLYPIAGIIFYEWLVKGDYRLYP